MRLFRSDSGHCLTSCPTISWYVHGRGHTRKWVKTVKTWAACTEGEVLVRLPVLSNVTFIMIIVKPLLLFLSLFFEIHYKLQCY